MPLDLSTYAGLQVGIATWINRPDDVDLVAAIPSFIQILESQLTRDVRWRKMIARDQTVADEAYESLPDDYLELVDVKFVDGNAVLSRPLYRTPAQLDAIIFGRGVLDSGIPDYFTLENNQIRFDRIPASIALEVSSYVKLPALSGSNPANALLLEHPDIYLFGSLMHAEGFLKNDPRIATWAALYRAAVDALEAQDERAQQAPGPIAMTSSRTF